jgi:hypothetical protein
MHDIILKGLSSLHGLSNEQELSNFLRGLRSTARCLWRAYQSNVVNVSYRKQAVQAAYMLRYFPHYAEVTRVALDELYMQEVLPFQEELLYVNLFGYGPAPELCGIMQFLKSRFSRSEMLIAHLLDAASDSWRYSRQITLNYLAPTLWDKELLEVHSIHFDLSQPGSAASLTTLNDRLNRIGQARLVMFQNCLNEFPKSIHDVVTENFLDLLQMMKPGKIMLVIDRAGYQCIVDLLSRISSLAEEHGLAKVLIFDQDRVLDCNPILERMPRILTENLFVRKISGNEIAPDEDGLICTTRVRHHCLALQRS